MLEQMKMIIPLILCVFFLAGPFSCPPASGETAEFVLTGRLVDAAGNPVSGGEVFVYDSIRTRRPADFISPLTDRTGRYRLVLPAGTYWVVARVRNSAAFGPLPQGGKHSGEAQELEAVAGGEKTVDFTVADVREMARTHRKPDGEYCSVEGRILGKEGKPVLNSYASARLESNKTRLPEYISPWSDAGGNYALLLPPGRYCLAAATVYPPEDVGPCDVLLVKTGEIAVARDIRIHYTQTDMEK
jgi:hypothetical protein